jgi:RimJ/RimL family protein N-acetyltransferase
MTLWRIRATVDDRPGFLAVLAASLALSSVNILSVQVHATELGAVDEFLVDAPDGLSEQDLRAAVVKGRGRDPWVRRADAYGLVDVPTHLINLAARLVRDPDDLAPALMSLLSEVLVTWQPAHCAAPSLTEALIVLPDPSGGTLEIRRLDPPFTPAEFARAHVLVELAGTVTRRPDSSCQLVLADGSELTVRPADLRDLDAVRVMHEQCSMRSRFRRYLSGSAVPSDIVLRRLLTPANGCALVAEHDSGIVALANLSWDGPEAELGLLVVDAWQQRGVGTALARRALRLAGLSGREVMHVHAHADNAPMIRTAYRLGLPLHPETDGPMVTLSMRVKAGTGTPSRVR